MSCPKLWNKWKCVVLLFIHTSSSLSFDFLVLGVSYCLLVNNLLCTSVTPFCNCFGLFFLWAGPLCLCLWGRGKVSVNSIFLRHPLCGIILLLLNSTSCSYLIIFTFHSQPKMDKHSAPLVACLWSIHACSYWRRWLFGFLRMFFFFYADSQPSSTKLTIDKEFEQYFSMLML